MFKLIKVTYLDGTTIGVTLADEMLESSSYDWLMVEKIKVDPMAVARSRWETAR